MANFFKSSILVILSLIFIILNRKENNKTAYFTSIKNEYQNGLDPRTKVYLKDNDNIKIARNQNFKSGFKAVLNNHKIIFFNHFFNFNYFFGKVFLIDQKKIEIINLNLLIFIFNKLKIKNFHMIDDYRHVKLFSNVCKKSKTRLFLYQHGRFSETISIQKNLRNLHFEKYFVWSNFFKKKLSKIDKSINIKKIFLKKRFRKFSPNYKVRGNNILIVHENKISLNIYKDLIKNICKSKKKYKIFFRIRPFEKKDYELENFLKLKKVELIKDQDIYKNFKKIKFNYLVAFNSTMLLDASYFRIIPIMIYMKKPDLEDYIKDNVFLLSKTKNLYKILNKLSENDYKNCKTFKEKVWS